MSKTKDLRYLKVMISKFCPAGHLNLIFIRRILPRPRTIWAFQRVSHFSKKCSSTVYMKSALGLLGQFFLKMTLRGHVWMRRGKNLGWEGSTMDDVMINYLYFAKIVKYFVVKLKFLRKSSDFFLLLGETNITLVIRFMKSNKFI